MFPKKRSFGNSSRAEPDRPPIDNLVFSVTQIQSNEINSRYKTIKLNFLT